MGFPGASGARLRRLALAGLPILPTWLILKAISKETPIMTIPTLLRQSEAGQGGGLYVPVALPEGIDPAALSSVVEAIEKAMVVLAHARQEEVIARADRIAELATGLLEPSAELLEDRVYRMRTLQQVFAEGDWLTSDQLHALQADPPKSTSQPASDWKRRGRIFGVSRGGREYFASYQFDAMYEPLPVIRDALRAFGNVADSWVLAAWFHYPNAWILGPDGAPVAPKDALDRRDDLIRAAQRRIDSYVA
jgi:hypothetical protein